MDTRSKCIQSTTRRDEKMQINYKPSLDNYYFLNIQYSTGLDNIFFQFTSQYKLTVVNTSIP